MTALVPDALRCLKNSKTVLLLFALPPLLSLALMVQPLIGDFDYEYNEIMGIVAFAVSGLIVIALKRCDDQADRLTEPADLRSDLPALMKGLILISMSLFASLLIVFIYFIFKDACCLLRGLQWFLLLPMVSAFAGASVGFLISVLFKRFTHIWFAAVLLVSLILNLMWIKFSAPIFVYSLFWGYFPGPIYDEWIPINAVLLFHRIGCIIAGMLLIVTALIIEKKRRAPKKYWYAFVVLLSVVFIGFALRSEIGFDTDYGKLRAELGASRSSANMEWVYDRHIEENEIRWLTGLGEYYYEKIRRFLDLKSDRAITVFVYKDEYQKKRLMGAGRTNFAKIFNDEIHVNAGDAAGILEHEMIHVLANDFGHPLFGTLRIGFLEGLAVAGEWNENYFTPHEWAAALKRQDKLPDVTALTDARSFFKNASGISYIVSGSFSRFLIDTFGVASFKRIYYAENVDAVYGMSFGELSARWLHFLDSVKLSDDDLRLSGILLQPSIFEKRCPHFVADILEEAGEAMRLDDYSGADRALREALRVDRENYRIALQMSRNLFFKGDFEASLAIAGSLAKEEHLNFVTHGLVQLLIGDVLVNTANSDSAYQQYKKTADQFVRIPAITLTARLRLALIQSGHADRLAEMVRTPDALKHLAIMEAMRETDPQNDKLKLWYARLNFQQSRFESVVSLYSEASAPISDDLLEKERLWILAESCLRISKFDLSEIYWVQAKKMSVRNMEKEYIEQRLSLLNRLKKTRH